MKLKRGLRILKGFNKTWAISLVILLGTGLPNFAQAEAPLCQAIFTDDRALTEAMQSLDKGFRDGSKDYGSALSLARKINELSLEEKENWVRAIGRVYRQIPKKNPSPTAPRLVGGRRLLDRLLGLLESYDQRFKIAQDSGASGKSAYESFLGRQRQIFGIQYGSSEVSLLIEVIQGKLKTRNQKGGKAKVLLAGSFINGKGSLTDSDIDVSVNDASPEWVRETLTWAAPINESLRRSFPAANLTIETHGEPAVFYGKLNPVLIEVTADSVDILIFPPGQGSGEFDLRAREPQRYSW